MGKVKFSSSQFKIQRTRCLTEQNWLKGKTKAILDTVDFTVVFSVAPVKLSNIHHLSKFCTIYHTSGYLNSTAPAEVFNCQ